MRVRTADKGKYLVFWCPGCSKPHVVPVTGDKAWGFNGDKESPTLSPSILIHGDERVKDVGEVKQTENFGIGSVRCHFFLKNGNLEFCTDSGHGLAGKTVPLPEWPYAEGKFGGIDQ